MKQSSGMNLKFSGSKLQEGVIDIYDLSNTILAFGKSIEAIASNQGYAKNNKIYIEVSALKPGSFEVDIILNFENIKDGAGVVMTMALSSQINLAEIVTNILKGVVEVRKFLKGKPPKQIKVEQQNSRPVAIIQNFYGDNTTISMPVFNALQDKTVNSNIQQIYKPLSKDNGNVETIDITTNQSESISVNKEDAFYFEDAGELQKVQNHTIKATVTRLDSKTSTGLLTMKNGKRVSFESGGIELNKFDEAFIILAESLKLKVPIYVTGEAVFDMETNLKKILITKVKTETKLF